MRTAPIWESKILKELKQGRNVMVVGHANTLRGLVKTIDCKSGCYCLDIVESLMPIALMTFFVAPLLLY